MLLLYVVATMVSATCYNASRVKLQMNRFDTAIAAEEAEKEEDNYFQWYMYAPTHVATNLR